MKKKQFGLSRPRRKHNYNEEAGQELGFFRQAAEIRALSALKVIWEKIKKARNQS
ncbi:hypothetical protein [Salibacterium aidingense]|uniref:hypothetical protein n=1 Tax=Salibacterium aidingense TaxID=384933 RepID=UPI0004155969|nr:hypothetical protein [Salibacterium aidingense]